MFDLLTKPDPVLTEEEHADVKKVARKLMEHVTDRLVLDWRTSCLRLDPVQRPACIRRPTSYRRDDAGSTDAPQFPGRAQITATGVAIGHAGKPPSLSFTVA